MEKKMGVDTKHHNKIYLKTLLIKTKSVFFVLILSQTSKAQIFDSIIASTKYKPKIEFIVNTRNSFITQYFAKIRGVQIGLNYNNTFKVGVGYNWLASGVFSNKNLVVDNNIRVDLHYLSPYLEYTFYKSKKWKISIPVLFGIGQATRKTTIYTENTFLTLYEPYMVAEYTFLNYFNIGFGTGYRLVILGNRVSRRDYSAPIYVLNFGVSFLKIVKDLKSKNK